MAGLRVERGTYWISPVCFAGLSYMDPLKAMISNDLGQHPYIRSYWQHRGGCGRPLFCHGRPLQVMFERSVINRTGYRRWTWVKTTADKSQLLIFICCRLGCGAGATPTPQPHGPNPHGPTSRTPPPPIVTNMCMPMRNSSVMTYYWMFWIKPASWTYWTSPVCFAALSWIR